MSIWPWQQIAINRLAVFKWKTTCEIQYANRPAKQIIPVFWTKYCHMNPCMNPISHEGWRTVILEHCTIVFIPKALSTRHKEPALTSYCSTADKVSMYTIATILKFQREMRWAGHISFTLSPFLAPCNFILPAQAKRQLNWNRLQAVEICRGLSRALVLTYLVSPGLLTRSNGLRGWPSVCVLWRVAPNSWAN